MAKLKTDTGSIQVTINAEVEGEGLVIRDGVLVNEQLNGLGTSNLIAAVVLTADQLNIDFTGIPASYRDLQIVCKLRSDRASNDLDGVDIQLGTGGTLDSGANYDFWVVERDDNADDLTTESQAANNIRAGGRFTIPGDTAPASVFGSLVIDIPGYADTTGFQSVLSHGGVVSSDTSAGSNRIGNSVGTWRNTGVVDTIRLKSNQAANFVAGSSFYLYGLPVGGQLISGYSPILDHKPGTDTPDDEFDSSTLDAKWTAVSGVAGTVDPFAVIATDNPIYDLTTRPGWLLTQVRQGDGGTTGAVRIRQDFTLADGESIVIAHTLPTYSGLTATDNESAINITLNDDDSDKEAGNSVIVRWIVASAEQVQVYGGLTTNFLHNIYQVGRIVYTRWLRKDDGATVEYYLGLSEDGTNWNWAGASAVTGFAPGAELTNLWITMDSTSGGGTEESPIMGVYFVRQGSNDLDPWNNSGLIKLDSVPEWMTALAGRVAGETAHVDDNFFGATTKSGWTEVLPSGTATWTEGRGKLSVVSVNQTTNHTPAILQPITSASLPITIETKVTWALRDPADVGQFAALVFTDGTANTSKAVLFGPQQYGSSGYFILGGELDSRDGDGSAVAVLSITGIWRQVLEVYIRLIWSAANTFQAALSMDGVTWTDYGAGSFTATTITPTHFGFAMYAAGADFYNLASFDYFRVYDSDLSV